MASTPGTTPATQAGTTADPNADASSGSVVADNGVIPVECGPASPRTPADLTQFALAQAASPTDAGAAIQTAGAHAHSNPGAESDTGNSIVDKAQSPDEEALANPGVSTCAACAARPTESANDSEPTAPVPPITPATARPTGPRPDFSAIDQATSKHVVYDESAVKEQEMLFKIAVRSEMQRLVVGALRFGAYILAVLLAVRFWHLIGPSWGRWLSDGDLQAMDKMLFSSAFGGFVLSYLKDTINSK